VKSFSVCAAMQVEMIRISSRSKAARTHSLWGSYGKIIALPPVQKRYRSV